ncbi:MAG: hypothetical protein EHM45_10710 [Desulfobacteraceae bacterium]|nr:MAG: hypothetical protein EHM45_10710 [Desulfobacteraceae bacterium]
MIFDKKYAGDAAMREQLLKVGSPRSLHEVYGLFYGLLAAPKLVMPSGYIPLILGENQIPFESQEEAQQFMGGLMALWNDLVDCEKKGNFFLPDKDYPATLEGMRQRARDCSSLLAWFFTGLNMGAAGQCDAAEASPRASGVVIGRLLQEVQSYESDLQAEETASEERIVQIAKSLDTLEGALIQCVRDFSLGLKPLRMKVAREMQAMRNESAPQPARSFKVSRNQPCPCGSGKKYKRCCGLN